MRRSWLWTPPFLIAAAIVWLSHQTHYPGGVALPPPLDKVAHAAVFGALAFFLELAWRNVRHDFPTYRRHLWIFLGVLLFAVSDEWHQAFVPGRDCSALDWLADAVGAVMGLGLAMLPFVRGSRRPVFGWWRGTRARRDPGRPLILVADPHWSEELTGLQETTRLHPEADWLFLGDIFEVWVGLPGMETEAQRSFLWWVQERRNAGRWIGLWTGNRDYFLDRFSGRFDLLGEGPGGDLPEEGLVFEHGDLVNGGDLVYRLWNLFSRSSFIWLLIRMLPAVLAQGLALRLERAMRVPGRGRMVVPREAFAAAAAECPGATFLTGHFHVHATVGSGVALPWAHEGAFAVWDRGRLELLAAPSGTRAGAFAPRKP
ncbi:MAG TPA: VanZ family protein [Holophaga sp.]|nr:VanZ family protein [Holophaga sp.]HPS66309.1 VanZ family protein [Holophaga sp.]